MGDGERVAGGRHIVHADGPRTGASGQCTRDSGGEIATGEVGVVADHLREEPLAARPHRRAGVAGQFPRASSCSSIRLCAQPRPWPKHRSHFAVLIRISLRHARGSPMVAAMMPMLTSNTRGQGRQRKPMAFNGEVVYSGQSSMSYMAW